MAGNNYVQPTGQVNNPNPSNGPSIRTLEWKHMMEKEFADRIRGSVITTEIPFTPTDPEQYEYPFPDRSNAVLYSKYRARADSQEDLLICGRLGDYRYYDMDQAIGKAMKITMTLMDKN
ncbi:UDP-galactopyranose mutase [Candidatus Neomarinimicrobiota bacterium]